MGEGYPTTLRHQKSVFTFDPQRVAFAIRDYEDGPILWEVHSFFKQANSWHQNRAAASLHLQPFQQCFWLQVTGVVRGRIALDWVDMRYVPARGVACDGTDGLA